MAREFDIRESARSLSQSSDDAGAQRRLASDVSDQLDGAHRIRITANRSQAGRASALTSDNAPAISGNYIQRAIQHLTDIQPVLGFTETTPAEFTADPHVQETSSGGVAVHLQQLYKGIPVFQANETVSFRPDGSIRGTSGSSVSINEDTSTEPVLSAAEAVLKAAEYVSEPQQDELEEVDEYGGKINHSAVDISSFTPVIVTVLLDKADRTTIFERGPFHENITSQLVWFELDSKLILAWQTLITLKVSLEQFKTIVDSKNGEILHCTQLLRRARGRGAVFQVDGSQPRQMMDFPQPVSEFGLPIPANLPNGFPDDWISNNQMSGNCVEAQLRDTTPDFSGTLDNGEIVFDPLNPEGEEQMVLNIFYYNCFMHDYFYLLGFREGDGNFQVDNFGRGGVGFDRVSARAHPNPVTGTANMYTPTDGTGPIMNMGIVSSTGRHTAFDSSVVFHEYAHGVTNRLVGGRMNQFALEEAQSAGMGEGWGDYISCTINNQTVVGSWVVNNAGGIRQFPYNDQFPDNFGHVGTGRYVGEHSLGEIWCANLLEVNAAIGKNLATQLVIDALKLSPANPGFLDMRDAILFALNDKLTAGELRLQEHAEIQNKIWAVFAKYGMGLNASSFGASLPGITPDFTTPQVQSPTTIFAEASPNLAIPDNRNDGVGNTLMLNSEGASVGKVTVFVDIEHTYIGDLVVDVKSPAGEIANLHNRSGGSRNDLVSEYSSDNTASLSTLLDSAVSGEWTLTIRDRSGIDTGQLRRWSIEIEPILIT